VFKVSFVEKSSGRKTHRNKKEELHRTNPADI
jgi:hypothetical protein